MSGKEFVLDCVKTYVFVVTLINVTVLILGTRIAPHMQFGYEAFVDPLLYGLVGTIPNLVMYARRELTVRELIIRKVIQFLCIEILVLFVQFYGADSFWKQPQIIISVAVSIFIIYVLATIFEWMENYISAKRLTEELVRFQQSVEVDD